MFHIIIISKKTCVALKIEKRLHQETEFYMASVDTMFSINSQEELSIKSHSHKFS